MNPVLAAWGRSGLSSVRAIRIANPARRAFETVSYTHLTLPTNREV